MSFELETVELEVPLPRLTWNRDPAETYSDWKIVVKAEGCPDSKIYHVHKNVVGAGSRGSQYFTKAFQADGLRESKSATSELELSPAESRNFPKFLDFLYWSTIDFDYLGEPVEDRMVLRHFADYFGVPTLLQTVNESITVHMNENNMAEYLQQAQIYNDDKIVKATMCVATKHFDFLVASFDNQSGGCKAQYLDLLTPEQRIEALKLSLKEATRKWKEATNECSKFTLMRHHEHTGSTRRSSLKMPQIYNINGIKSDDYCAAYNKGAAFQPPDYVPVFYYET